MPWVTIDGNHVLVGEGEESGGSVKSGGESARESDLAVSSPRAKRAMRKLSSKKLSRNLDLVQKQIAIAHSTKNTKALERLRKMEAGYINERGRRLEHAEIEIDAFRAGKYPQGEFTESDLAEIAETYDPKVYEAPIMIGHASDYKGATQIPAFGWIGAVKVVGDHLKVVASQFSDQLKAWVKEGLYKKVSAAFYDPAHPSNPTPGKWHLHHLAFLGATPPQVKGLEGIMFCEIDEDGLEFAEIDIDAAEIAAEEDTYESIQESFASCLANIQDALDSDVDDDAKRSRMNQSLNECFQEIQTEIGLHFAFLEKADQIAQSEMSEIRRKLKEFADKIFKHKQDKEASDMDAQKEKEYTDKIGALEAQLAEFNEAKKKAEDAQKEAEAKAAEDKLKSEVKEFCEGAKLNTKAMDDLHLQDALVSIAKANGPLEFGETKTTALDVVKGVLSALATKVTVPPGEMKHEFSTDVNADKRPEVIKQAEKYVKDNPTAKEFSDCRTDADKINRAIALKAQGKLRF